MTNQQYDTLKQIALRILPLGTLVSSVMSIWGLPHVHQIRATFASLDVTARAVVTNAKTQWNRRNDGRNSFDNNSRCFRF